MMWPIEPCIDLYIERTNNYHMVSPATDNHKSVNWILQVSPMWSVQQYYCVVSLGTMSCTSCIVCIYGYGIYVMDWCVEHNISLRPYIYYSLTNITSNSTHAYIHSCLEFMQNLFWLHLIKFLTSIWLIDFIAC